MTEQISKDENCIFCKIIKGEIPAKKVYEDEKVLAFLDVNPVSRGHTLIIPKKHFENIFDIEEESLKEIINASKKISIFLKEKLNADGVNLLHASGKDAQQSVFHFHLHVVPRYKGDNLDTWPKSNYKELNFDELIKEIAK
jgi:histidine triad (HIT) family protein